MSKDKELEALKCGFCGREFEFRVPTLDWPTPACDECLARDSSRGRVVRRVPAKHVRVEFDSPRGVQMAVDRGNLETWLEMRRDYEQQER